MSKLLELKNRLVTVFSDSLHFDFTHCKKRAFSKGFIHCRINTVVCAHRERGEASSSEPKQALLSKGAGAQADTLQAVLKMSQTCKVYFVLLKSQIVSDDSDCFVTPKNNNMIILNLILCFKNSVLMYSDKFDTAGTVDGFT